MSKQRYLDIKFWDDSYIINKDPILQLHIKKQKSIEDPDCPSGVCGSGGRE